MDLGGWGGRGWKGEGRIHISDLLQDIRVFLQERDGEGREEGGAGEGGRRGEEIKTVSVHTPVL